MSTLFMFMFLLLSGAMCEYVHNGELKCRIQEGNIPCKVQKLESQCKIGDLPPKLGKLEYGEEIGPLRFNIDIRVQTYNQENITINITAKIEGKIEPKLLVKVNLDFSESSVTKYFILKKNARATQVVTYQLLYTFTNPQRNFDFQVTTTSGPLPHMVWKRKQTSRCIFDMKSMKHRNMQASKWIELDKMVAEPTNEDTCVFEKEKISAIAKMQNLIVKYNCTDGVNPYFRVELIKADHPILIKDGKLDKECKCEMKNISADDYIIRVYGYNDNKFCDKDFTMPQYIEVPDPVKLKSGQHQFLSDKDLIYFVIAVFGAVIACIVFATLAFILYLKLRPRPMKHDDSDSQTELLMERKTGSDIIIVHLDDLSGPTHCKLVKAFGDTLRRLCTKPVHHFQNETEMEQMRQNTTDWIVGCVQKCKHFIFIASENLHEASKPRHSGTSVGSSHKYLPYVIHTLQHLSTSVNHRQLYVVSFGKDQQILAEQISTNLRNFWSNDSFFGNGNRKIFNVVERTQVTYEFNRLLKCLGSTVQDGAPYFLKSLIETLGQADTIVGTDTGSTSTSELTDSAYTVSHLQESI